MNQAGDRTLFPSFTLFAESTPVRMDRATNADMADMHMAYGAANGNAREAARIYQQRFPNRYHPDHRVFTRIHTRLCETGSVQVRREGTLGGPAAWNVDAEEEVLEYFRNHPTRSTREAENLLHIPHTTIWRILNTNNQYPFHLQRVQSLRETDFPHRLHFARWFLNKEREQPNFASKVLFTDEALFTRDGVFNCHNIHLWSERDHNPHGSRESHFQVRFSVNVWAGIIGDHVVGPYIFPQRLTGQSYSIFLDEVLPQLLENVPLHIRNQSWFQHDGAPPHFSANVRALLDARYRNRWIGRGGPILWPPRSPDLTPLDFYYWGHLKNMIYQTPVESEVELIGRLVDAAARITETPGVFERVRHSLSRRLQACIEANGQNFEHLL